MMRWQCTDCDWIGTEDQIDRVEDPKPGSDMSWNICPECRAADSFRLLCDEPQCNKEATCGWPFEHGYRNTCYRHSKFAEEGTSV